MARGVMHRKILGTRNYRPIVILVSDGLSSEPQKTIEAIERLKYSLHKSKDKVNRIAICVEGANENELISFASIGCFWHYDGTYKTNFPFLIKTEEVELLRFIIRSFEPSIMGPGMLQEGLEGDMDIVITDDGDDEDWEE